MKFNNIIIIFYFACHCMIPRIIIAQEIAPPKVKDVFNYSFIVAGHAYGSHYDTCFCIHNNFSERIKNCDSLDVDFLVFPGDLIRSAKSQRNWQFVLKELEEFNHPFYIARGNHENSDIGKATMDSLYGNTYYAFRMHSDLFVFIDNQLSILSISEDQIDFIKAIMENLVDINNVFIFMGEPLWNNHEKYRKIRANSRSRLSGNKSPNISRSNFWEDLYPILAEITDVDFFIVSGDFAGNQDAIPAFYDKWNNVTLIGTGMGEVIDGNFLIVNVRKSQVNFEVVPILPEGVKHDIYYYTAENMIDYYNPIDVPSQSISQKKRIIVLLFCLSIIVIIMIVIRRFFVCRKN